MNILDRYVLKQWLTLLGYVVVACFGLLVLMSMQDSLGELREAKASTRDLLVYYAVLAPSFLSIVLPISVLVSLLYALGQLHRNNEIIAMRACGIGLWRITRWIWAVVAALSLLLFELNSSIIPWSVEKARVVRENIQFSNEVRQKGGASEQVGLVSGVGYQNRGAGRVTMIGTFSAFSNRAFGIHVAELDTGRRETRRVVAKEGFWDETKRSWVLMNGHEIRFDPATGEVAGRIERFEQREFPEFTDDPDWMLRLTKKTKNLSFFELGDIIASPESAANPRLPAYQVRYHSLLAGTLSCLIAAALAIPFAVAGVRVNPAVGVSKSIGFFALFIVLTFVGNQLGEQRTLSPVLAAWIPNLAMAGLGGWYFLRVR